MELGLQAKVEGCLGGSPSYLLARGRKIPGGALDPSAVFGDPPKTRGRGWLRDGRVH